MPTRVEYCQCHGMPLSWCPDHGHRAVRNVAAGTLLDVLLAPASGRCNVCGRDYSCGQAVVKVPPPDFGMPYAHDRCPA